jgi:beta-lactam-binding protein with PASTA domain
MGTITMATTTPPSRRPAHDDLTDVVSPAIEGLEIDEPRRRRIPLLLAILALGTILYVLVRLMGAQLGSDEETTAVEVLPDVVEADVATALQELEDLGFVPIARFEENDRYPDNQVFEQSPPGGTKLDLGTEITLRVSAGAGAVPVPDVVGLQAGPARSLLQASGFAVGIVAEFHDTVDLDDVVRQDPPARTDVPLAAVITITVSKGREPVELPDLERVARRDAVSVLEGLGFELAFFEEVSDAEEEEDRIPEGEVIRTDPPAGDKLAPGATVSVILSTGEFIDLPDVLGLTGGAAVAVLLGRDLEVDPILVPLPRDHEDDGLVIKMDPEPGERVSREDLIRITIGIADNPPEAPEPE